MENSAMVENNTETVDLRIISIERIKPSSATPHHLRTLKLSILDQYMVGFYPSSIIYFPNTCVSNDVKVRCLKESLSEILTRYYPFAGEINDNCHIECNDKGVYFIEARVNQTLEEFLCQPDDQKIRKLNPQLPESSSRNYVMSVQVNVYNCGGISISVSATHKILDAGTYFTFMKAWAAACGGFPETVSPSFDASEVFPNNPSLKFWFPSNLIPTKVVATKRFVFDSTTVAFLKTKTITCSNKHTSLASRGTTRAEVITALIWKAAAKAACTVKSFGLQSPHALLSLVNLRKRALPPLPNESIGNLFTKAIGICFPIKQPALSEFVGIIRESIAKINADHIESLKGEKGSKALTEMNNLLNGMKEGHYLFANSMLNSGIYELDFGWGKPIWFYNMTSGSGVVTLTDVTNGGGVEAIVSLSCEEMEIFELDPEILSYATLNPSPLRILH
ncbi:transferase, Chloramphenicol acetyltransferase-like domain protein [Artemisia annua]|uniref:Transferase, Chloramphenicol acetyltransferase-like domain protein n=1 Tax=Artemisia annua TaxID=35608 RepID=A0A2U1NCW7_ARTAN|nr:transferase, Chloramphenicol acetyltransferase-like domain protein [Artemisia annua]